MNYIDENYKDYIYSKFTDEDVVYDIILLNAFKDDIIDEGKTIPTLYRYSSADYYNIRGLETQTLYLSPNNIMNDVFEGLFCEIDEKVQKKMLHYKESAYIKSFSESKDNLLMWAHYADSYSGMCVEYDMNKLKREILCHLYPVFYSEKRIPESYIQETLDELKELKFCRQTNDTAYETTFLNDYMYLFLVKPRCWEYEKEWRIIVTYPQLHESADYICTKEDESKELSLLFELDNRQIYVENCIKAVYLGPQIKKEIKEHIKEICKERLNSIPVYTSKLSDSEYELEFELAK